MPARPRKKLFRILSIDGGGIRGIIPGEVLAALEQELQKTHGDPSVRLADFFDLVAGTSTGGILTCMLLCPDEGGRPRFTARDAVELYLERGDEIFDISVAHRMRSLGGLRDEKYPADGLEETLQSYLRDLRLSDLLRPTLITAYDIKHRAPYFFKQHRTRIDGGLDEGRDFHVRDVARATSAAPTYFEVARVSSILGVPRPLVDGGVFANNPALCAYAEARAWFDRTAAELCILSLGTGSSQKPFHYREAKDWGLAQWAKPVLEIMMSGVSETVDYQLRQIFDAVGRKKQYLRVQADLGRERDDVSEMDNVERENLVRLRQIGLELTVEHRSEIADFARLLGEPAPSGSPGG